MGSLPARRSAFPLAVARVDSLRAMRSVSSLRVGLADSVDPRDMQAGSGASASLLHALDQLIAEAVPLNGAPQRLGRIAHLSSAALRLPTERPP